MANGQWPERAAAAHRPHALGEAQVLDRDRDAVEQAARQALGGHRRAEQAELPLVEREERVVARVRGLGAAARRAH